MVLYPEQSEREACAIPARGVGRDQLSCVRAFPNPTHQWERTHHRHLLDVDDSVMRLDRKHASREVVERLPRTL